MKFCIKAILFDIDGTVINWTSVGSFIPKIVQNPSVFITILQDIQTMERKRGEIFASGTLYKQREKQELSILDKDQVNAKTKDVILNTFQQKIQMGVVSDNRSIEKLKQLELEHFFSVVINCRETGFLKPSPEGLLRASSQLGFHPSQILYIGDRKRIDDRACFQIGMHFLSIEYIDRLEC